MAEPNIKPKHGGARPGAGRHTADGAKGLKNYQVMLTPNDVALGRKFGKGNLSLGIRLALNRYMKQAPITCPEEPKSEPVEPEPSPKKVLPPAPPILSPR